MKTPFAYMPWALLLCCAPALSQAHEISIPLRGFEEVPSLSTPARGLFQARIEAGAIRYRLAYRDLQSEVLQAHIHFGQKGVNGGVSAFLCQTATSPDPAGLAPACPQSGAVIGMLLPANIVGPEGQGISAGEFDELVAAIRHGVAYVNVHSATYPAGEIRGQLERNEHDGQPPHAGE